MHTFQDISRTLITKKNNDSKKNGQIETLEIQEMNDKNEIILDEKNENILNEKNPT